MNVLNYTLQLNDRMSSALNRVGASSNVASRGIHNVRTETASLNNTNLSGIGGMFNNLLKSIGPLVLLTVAVTSLKQAFTGSEAAYNIQSQAEKKLEVIMRQRTGATNEQIDSIKRLASAQQALGVIGDEVQLSGAQQLATFVTQKNSIDNLLPAMNNLLAQQKGLKATSEDAVNIGNLMGKVMQGQTAALTRVGVTFTASQEKVLKYGTEQQRAATLAQVITDNVGEMNKALAATPEGKLKQASNTMGDVQERLGKLLVLVKTAFAPVDDYIATTANKVMDFFTKHEDSIYSFVSVLSEVVIKTFKTLGNIISWVYSSYKSFMDGLHQGKVIYIAIASVIVALTAALVTYQVVTGLITLATSAWTAAQWLLNVAVTANPVGLFIAGIVALLALIGFLIIKIDGWGDTWQNVVKLCTLVFDSFKTNLELKWLQIQNTFMNGLEVIEKGWYKLQSLWNEDAANAGLAKLESQRNERAKEIAETKNKIDDINNQISNLDVIQLKMNDTSFSSITNGIKNKLGISAPGVPGMDTPGGEKGGKGGGVGGGNAGKDTANSIATGGSKTTHVYVTIGEMGNNMKVYVNDLKEGAESIRDKVLDELTRALTMAQGQI